MVQRLIRALVVVTACAAFAAAQTCKWVGDPTYGYQQCSSGSGGASKVAIVSTAQAAYEHDLATLRKRYRAECSAGAPMEKECREEKETGMKLHAFDLSMSTRLPLSRAILDLRPDACGDHAYPKPQPETTLSVVLVFYNEGTSTLLRTAQSCLDRTPPELLEEVLLVDDGNPLDDPRVQRQMEEIRAYVAAHPKVRMIRLDEHHGLIVAKNRGGQAAKGSILAYMDSHCEVGYGWAEPLVAAIERDPKTVAVPLIDAVGWEYFDYLPGDLMRGIMSWSLYFTWQLLTEEHKVRACACAAVRNCTCEKKIPRLAVAWFVVCIGAVSLPWLMLLS